jgi:predicted enzyme related to lactoylglutathione lyase
MAAPIVFFDLAGPDSALLEKFYAEVFDWTPSDTGQVSVEVIAPLAGAFREDPTEKRIYLGVADIDATLKEIEAHGGSVDAARFEVPGVVVLGLFRDPAGNEMGLVEMDGDVPLVP